MTLIDRSSSGLEPTTLLMHLKIKQGIDIPIQGKAKGPITELADPRFVALHVGHLPELKFKVLAKVGDQVCKGEPLLHDKECPNRLFLAPAGGVVREIRRGIKRRLLSIVLERSDSEEELKRSPFDPDGLTREEVIDRLCEGGIFSLLYMRPFHQLARPHQIPKAIFIKAVETAPLVPPAELQVQGHEAAFARGLQVLRRLTEGPIHLVHAASSTFAPFTEAEEVQLHSIEGPHPVANLSVAIYHLAPIRSVQEVVWTCEAHDVIRIGYLSLTGKVHTERVVAVAGPGVTKGQQAFLRTREGISLKDLTEGRVEGDKVRLISGDPLMGDAVEEDAFLGMRHFTVTLLPYPRRREFLHFLRWGGKKFSATKTYLSGHRRTQKEYPFSINLHGEERAFSDPVVYDRVMPLPIPTALLVKAVLAGDYEKAEELGLLQVAPEDFALPTFICPSKIEMVHIMREGLNKFAQELLS